MLGILVERVEELSIGAIFPALKEPFVDKNVSVFITSGTQPAKTRVFIHIVEKWINWIFIDGFWIFKKSGVDKLIFCIFSVLLGVENA